MKGIRAVAVFKEKGGTDEHVGETMQKPPAPAIVVLMLIRRLYYSMFGACPVMLLERFFTSGLYSLQLRQCECVIVVGLGGLKQLSCFERSVSTFRMVCPIV